MHTAAHPMGQIPDISWLRPWRDTNVSSKKFFGASNEEGNYYYFFSNLRKMPREFRRDIGDTLQLQARFRPTMEVGLLIQLHYCKYLSFEDQSVDGHQGNRQLFTLRCGTQYVGDILPYLILGTRKLTGMFKYLERNIFAYFLPPIISNSTCKAE